MLQDPRLVKHLPNMIGAIWKHIGLPQPTPIQLDVADYLQYGPRKRLIEAFRGVGKSYLTVGFVIWRLYQDPDRKIMVISASKNLADNFSTMCLQLIHSMPELEWLKPNSEQREAKVQFDVGPSRIAKDPSLRSVGITGQLTGSRADDCVLDDVEVPNNSQTQQMRDKLGEAVKEVAAILKPHDDTTVTVLGTPQCEDSLYNKMVARGYKRRIWPARFPDKKVIPAYDGDLAPTIEEALREHPHVVGKTTDPDRFDDATLLEKELEYGRSGFALQFMLDSSASDANRFPLKLADLMVMPLDADRAPEKLAWGNSHDLVVQDVFNIGFGGDRYYRPAFISEKYIEYTKTVMAIDPSGRGKDETGYAVVKILNGQLFLVASGGLQGGYKEDNLKALAVVAKEHKANIVIVEPNFGDGMFVQLFSPILNKIHPCLVEDTERSSSQKEARIVDSLEPVLNRHRLIVDPKVIEADKQSVAHLPVEFGQRCMLFYQLSRLTKDKNSLSMIDRLDALALCVHYCTSLMARDLDDAVASRKEDDRDASIRLFLEELDLDLPSEKYSAIQW